MAATVFYESAAELAAVSNAFTLDGVATDPTTVSLTITAPSGSSTTYTYAAAQITRTGAGAYSKDIACSEAGTWQYVWTGTGTVSDVAAGTWTVRSTQLQKNYTTLELLKAALKISDSDRDDLLIAAVAAASRAIDAHTGRRFYLDAAATARTFSARDRVLSDRYGQHLFVDEIANATLTVEEGSASTAWTPVTSTAYELEPDNALATGRPATTLLRVSGTWTTTGKIRITTRWGWPAVPDEVAQAALIQATRLYRRKDSPEGVLGSAEWGVIRVARVDPDVQSLLQHLTLPGMA